MRSDVGLRGGETVAAALVFCLFLGLHARPVGAQQESGPTSRKMSDAQVIKDLKSYVDGLAAEDKFSGAVLVAKDGVPVFEKAYGLASKAFNVPNRLDTKFNLGSLNKMFTAVAVAQLAEQGRLRLTDPVIKHLPDYPNKLVARQVTIRHLLTHTSGMGDYFNEKYNSTSKDRFKKIQDYFPLFVDDPLSFEPGRSFQYSNAGYIVLGAIVEKVSGQSYYDYVREHIYKPAGMVNTDAYELDRDTPNLAVGYTVEGAAPPGRKNNLFLHVCKGSPAGGGFSTVEDLLKFATALSRHKLLSHEYTEIIFSGKLRPGDPELGYAYGFENDRSSGTRIVGHHGGYLGINSQLDIYLDLGYTVAVMSNYDPPAATRIAERLRRRFTGQALPVPVKVSAEVLKMYAGEYQVETPGLTNVTVAVTVENGELWTDIKGAGRHKMLPLSETEFFDEEYLDVRLTFRKGGQGQATVLELKGAGQDFTARKM
jgi:D-alanyl-D-alanine carboxypeptidase